SLFLIPFGIIFVVMALRAKVVLFDDRLEYTMLWTKRVPYKEIKKISFAKPQTARYYISNQGMPIFLNLVTVIPLVIEYEHEGKMKKTKFSSNFFENAEEMVGFLLKKTKRKLEVE
ncbi:hypothetical protein HY496_01705, partial [Candidatus Woesearchaeota archaeon]|nr:hypothetical protein [Candidatus Woesearchaeota archaeon]